MPMRDERRGCHPYIGRYKALSLSIVTASTREPVRPAPLQHSESDTYVSWAV